MLVPLALSVLACLAGCASAAQPDPLATLQPRRSPKPPPPADRIRGGAAAAAAAAWGGGGGGGGSGGGGGGGDGGAQGRTGGGGGGGEKKKRRRRTASAAAVEAEEPTVPADVASSIATPPSDGGVAAKAAAAADAATTSVENIRAPVAAAAERSPAPRSGGYDGGGGGGGGGGTKMPSLFTSPDEAMYDRYAACLAATEGLRRARDAALAQRRRRGRPRGASLDGAAESGNGGAGGSGSAVVDPGGNKKPFFLLRRMGEKAERLEDDEEYKRACAQYVLQSSRVIRALGLSVSQFNQLGREVGNDAVLKERVTEQAYLYRMAATLNMDKIPLIEDPSSEQLLKAHRRRRVQMFARSMTEIEELRTEQTERLKRSLNVDRLPEGINICDPSILPILSPKVRAVCEAFPLQAEMIVKKYGLNSDEFNQMLEETRCNPIFRWRVKKYMGKSGEKQEG